MRSDFDRALALLKVPPVQAELNARGGGPGAAVVAYDLGVVQLARGRRDEALALWNKIDAKDLPEKWLAVGANFDAQGDRRSALEQYRRYLTAAPTGRHAEQVRRWVEAMGRFYNGPGEPAPAPPTRAMARRSNDARRESPR